MNKKIIRLIAYYERTYGTRDPFKIARYLGIYVGLYPLGNVAGNYRYLEHAKWIFLNSEIQDEIFLRVVMAHELGHAVLHWKENCCFMAHKTLLLTSKIERQANLFAAYLLIDDAMLQDYVGCTQEQFCICTGFPDELIELRLKNYDWR